MNFSLLRLKIKFFILKYFTKKKEYIVFTSDGNGTPAEVKEKSVPIIDKYKCD